MNYPISKSQFDDFQMIRDAIENIGNRFKSNFDLDFYRGNHGLAMNDLNDVQTVVSSTDISSDDFCIEFFSNKCNGNYLMVPPGDCQRLIFFDESLPESLKDELYGIDFECSHKVPESKYVAIRKDHPVAIYLLQHIDNKYFIYKDYIINRNKILNAIQEAKSSNNTKMLRKLNFMVQREVSGYYKELLDDYDNDVLIYIMDCDKYYRERDHKKVAIYEKFKTQVRNIPTEEEEEVILFRDYEDNNEYLMVDLSNWKPISSILLGTYFMMPYNIRTDLDNIKVLCDVIHDEVCIRKDSSLGHYLMKYRDDVRYIYKNNDAYISYDKIVNAFNVASFDGNLEMVDEILPLFRGKKEGEFSELNEKYSSEVLSYILLNDDFARHLRKVEHAYELILYEDECYYNVKLPIKGKSKVKLK